MNAEEIAKWVVDNRYNCTTISDEDMYKIVLGEITLLLNKEETNIRRTKLCRNCKYWEVLTSLQPCLSCGSYQNHEWA